MASWAVRSLLLSAVFGAVFCDSPELDVVNNIIANSNKAFRDHNATEIELPDIGWLFEPIRFREGRLGLFDTLELQPDPKIDQRANHYGTVYTYDLRTGLRNLTIHYKFQVPIPFFQNDGNVTITVNDKSFQLGGRVLVKQDGTCFAILSDAKVAKLGDFQVKFEPDNAPYITKIYQAVLNAVHQHMIPVINMAIRAEISKPSFRKNFNKVVCAEVTRNSTTEAPTEAPTTEVPTTEVPTTEVPTTEATSRVPYHPTTAEPEPTTREPYYSTTAEPEQTSRRPYYPTTAEPEPTTRRPYYPTTRRPYYPTTRRPYYPTTRRPYYPTRRPYHTTTEEPEDEY